MSSPKSSRKRATPHICAGMWMGLYTAGSEMGGTLGARMLMWEVKRAVNEYVNGINTQNSAQGVFVLLTMPRDKMVVAPITGAQLSVMSTLPQVH